MEAVEGEARLSKRVKTRRPDPLPTGPQIRVPCHSASCKHWAASRLDIRTLKRGATPGRTSPEPLFISAAEPRTSDRPCKPKRKHLGPVKLLPSFCGAPCTLDKNQKGA